MTGNILIVDDDRDMCELAEAFLRPRGFQVAWRTSAEEAIRLFETQEFDAVVTDLNMPRINGIELCRRMLGIRPDVPVIVMTGFGSMEAAIDAIRAGAHDFVTKPVEMERLALTLSNAVRQRRLLEQIHVLDSRLAESQPIEGFVGQSEAMMKLLREVHQVADTESAVLVTGESGTGKELVARALHQKSRRCTGPFVAVNCAALPESLLESALFGHRRGAFTDARTDQKGLFAQASGGTLLLDEIGEMPLVLQPKLLRALEDGAVRPVGADREVPADVRFIAATNRDLEADVQAGRFRDDLYFRINVIQIEVPPLRSRGTDILLLAEHFLELFCKRLGKQVLGFAENAAQKMLEYSWPGNVRELRNAIEHAVALTGYDRISLADLPEKIREYRERTLVVGGENPAELLPMHELEKRYIRHVLDAVAGNKAAAARILGFDRKTLYRKLGENDESGDAR